MKFNSNDVVEDQGELDKATEIVNTERRDVDVVRTLKIITGLSIVGMMLVFSFITYFMKVLGFISWSYLTIFAPVSIVIVLAIYGLFTYGRALNNLNV